MPTPYDDLPPQAFWRNGVAGGDLTGLFAPKFPITRDTAVATAGSCFAQHVGRALRSAGLTVLDAEPAPPGLDPDTARSFGFGLYSGRYGNIYTTRQLIQLFDEAFGRRSPEDLVWQREGRFYEGVPVGEKHSAPTGALPDRIRLFRTPILDEWIARGDESLEHLVAHVLIHEVGHHFGLSDADIEALEQQAE